MKTILRISLRWLVVLGLGVNSLGAEEMFEGESLGKLKLGQRADVVAKVLGKPDSKGEQVLWEAIGEWVEEGRYPEQGVTLAMCSKKKEGAKTVLNISAEAPCKLATSRGIKIGSSEADVAKAYAKERSKEESVAGQLFVAGSVYGGVIFTIEKGKVVQIFIGAAAE